nr:ribonuclease H-like domain-containing protein [Tanacetum cinerariifolium]
MFVYCCDISMVLSRHLAPGQWFAAYITTIGFSPSRCDSSLFIYKQGDDTAFLLLYVDDIVLTASSDRLLQQIIASLHREFSMTDLEILERAHMVGCNPSWTHVDTESKLGDGGTPVVNPTLYRSLTGASFLCSQADFGYVQGISDYGLQLFSSTDSFIAYSDANWVGCLTMRRSTSGYCFFLGNNLLSWSSKRQPMLSRYSAEAEYHSVANAAFEYDVALPVELAKARSRGRSAMYRMARAPYYRGPSTLNKKIFKSYPLILLHNINLGEVDSEHGLLDFSQHRHLYRLSLLENLKGQMEARCRKLIFIQRRHLNRLSLLRNLKGQMEAICSIQAGKHKRSVLDDPGSGGSMRRTQWKANLL